jgi:high-affinity iron transporter
LLTGVLGIPADPRLIEVLGWFAYLVPTMLFLLWPLRHRPAGRALATMRLAIAGVLVVIAGVLAIAVPVPSYSPPASATVTGQTGTGQTGNGQTGNGQTGTTTTVSVPSSLAAATQTTHDGIASRVMTTHHSGPTAGHPSTLTLEQLVSLNGGRLPIGINASQNPGPFDAVWLTKSTTSIWVYRGGILDAQRTATTIVTLTGGGLVAARTISPDSAQTQSWRMPASTRSAIADRVAATGRSAAELLLWKLWIPIVMLLTALVLTGYVLRSRPRPAARIPQEKVKETYA